MVDEDRLHGYLQRTTAVLRRVKHQLRDIGAAAVDSIAIVAMS